jgi:hydrogenase maturation protease
MKKTLLIGFGNIDRQDDGVAWHVMLDLLHYFEHPQPAEPDEGVVILDTNPSFLFLLQLTPEIAEEIARYEQVCFIDAHTGYSPQHVQMEKISPVFQNSAFTHHMTPQTSLSLANSLYCKSPEAVMISIRGHKFGFSRNLSTETKALISPAVDKIIRWITQEN